MASCKVLLVVASDDLEDELESLEADVVQKAPSGADVDFSFKRYVEPALSKLAHGRFDVVVIDQWARKNKKAAGRTKPAEVVATIRAVAERAPQARIILLKDQLDDDSVFDASQAGATLVPMRTGNYVERLQAVLEEQLDRSDAGEDTAIAVGRAGTKPEYRLSLTFRGPASTNGPGCSYRLAVWDDDEPLSAGTELPIHCEPELIDAFLAKSSEIDEIANLGRDPIQLRRCLTEIGKLGAQIVADGQFAEDYDSIQKKHDDHRVSAIRLRINTCPEFYPGLYEAMLPSSDDLPFVVRHPTYRHVEFEAKPATLRWNAQDPINILVVQANDENTPGRELMHRLVPEEQHYRFAPLPHVDAECRIFERLKHSLEEKKPWQPFPDRPDLAYQVALPVSEVTILRLEDSEEPLSLRLERALTENRPPERRYDILHFAGHSFALDLKEGEKDCLLVLPSSDRTRAEAVTMSELSTWLQASGAQFVYLSCCAGLPSRGGSPAAASSAAIAQILTQKRIPVALGFRWDVEDDKAYEFAAQFYVALLAEGRSFDEAMKSARQKIYDESDTLRTLWAAPVLLLQSA